METRAVKDEVAVAHRWARWFSVYVFRAPRTVQHGVSLVGLDYDHG